MDVLSATDETDRAEPCSVLLQGSLCSSYNFWVGLQHITFESGMFECASYCNLSTDCIMITNITILISPTSWSRVLREKLTGPQLVKKFPLVVWNVKVHYCVRYHPQPVHILMKISSVHVPHPTSWRSIVMLSPIHDKVFQVVSFPQVFPSRPCMHYILHAIPISFFLIWSPK